MNFLKQQGKITFVGIDTGKNGGIAIFTIDNDTITDIQVMPYDTYILAELGEKGIINENSIITIEKVHAFAGQGVVSMFSFGKAFGEVIGCLAGIGVKEEQINFVSPQEWKKFYNLYHQDKKASCKKAHELIKKLIKKDINLKRTKRCKVDHDGMAEALLIGYYGKVE